MRFQQCAGCLLLGALMALAILAAMSFGCSDKLGREPSPTAPAPAAKPISGPGTVSLSLSSTTPGAFTATWTAPSDPPSDYRIRWAKDAESYLSWRESLIVTTATSHTVTGLDAGVLYKFSVRARFNAGPYADDPWAGPWARGTVTVADGEETEDVVTSVQLVEVVEEEEPVAVQQQSQSFRHRHHHSHDGGSDHEGDGRHLVGGDYYHWHDRSGWILNGRNERVQVSRILIDPGHDFQEEDFARWDYCHRTTIQPNCWGYDHGSSVATPDPGDGYFHRLYHAHEVEQHVHSHTHPSTGETDHTSGRGH